MNEVLFPSIIRHFRNEQETGAEMCPAIVYGIVTGRASQLLANFWCVSPGTVPEFFANVSWAKLPSRF